MINLYKCQLCEFITEERSKIHKHHILPKELNGSNKKHNLVYLCANCHNKVYIIESKTGNHSIKSKQSIIINGWRLCSNSHRILEYIDESNQIQYSEERI